MQKIKFLGVCVCVCVCVCVGRPLGGLPSGQSVIPDGTILQLNWPPLGDEVVEQGAHLRGF